MELKNVYQKVESEQHLAKGAFIQPREPDVEALRNTPKLWLGNNPKPTISNNIFSLYIPRGELFFIRSVNYYKHKIKDPELKAMVVAFMQQEVLHSKAHDAFNESFKQHGFDVDRELEFINKKFEWVEKFIPKKVQLGMTVFFEHVTATQATSALENLPNSTRVDKEVAEFLMWHAAEEIEHKNVAFDVFKEVGGGYFLRVFSAILGPLLIYPLLRESALRMREAYNEPFTEAHKAELKTLAAENNKVDNMKREIKKYFVPFFHPRDKNHTPLLKQWYERVNSSAEEAIADRVSAVG